MGVYDHNILVIKILWSCQLVHISYNVMTKFCLFVFSTMKYIQ